MCVSRNFDKDNIIKQIIEHTTSGENINLTNFNNLQLDLQSRISGKRFLLVLDDVWYDERYGDHINKESWREVIAPLGKALPGSKILVTTRMELVAKILNSRSSRSLPGIGQDASWSLFKDRIGFHLGPELKEIGQQIVQKLNGLPLSLKVMAGHLSGKYRVAEWNEVLHNDTLNLNDMLEILRLSYGSLPARLQDCFAYCGLFPKGYHIDPNRLIHMWIAQGFIDINERTDMTLEDAGRSYFKELLERSFFQILVRDNQTFYIMHDAMSDLALHVSEGECLRVEHESTEEIPVYTRHVSIYSENMGGLVKCDLKALRSLIVLSRSWFCSKVCLNNDILDKLKSVRVLDISGCCLEKIPKSVNKLIHLRYLGIRRTYFPMPKKISLYHLQALFVQYHSCYSSKEFTTSRGKTVGCHFDLPVKSLSKLINLVHIDIEKAYVLMLSSTQRLASVDCSGEFVVDEEEGSLVGLKDLNKLRGQLIIKSLDKVKSREGAAKAHLYKKKDITKLELHWGSYQCHTSKFAASQYHMVPGFIGYFQRASGTFAIRRYPVVPAVTGSSQLDGATRLDFEVLDVLKPHPDLEELTICGYSGVKSPSWLEYVWLSRVQSICLRDCGRWEVLPPLGDLPLLKTLEVRRMKELKTLGQEFSGSAGFPVLERLQLEKLPETEWCLVDNDQVLQNLRYLFVTDCPKFTAYPTYPPKLEHIAVLDKEKIEFKSVKQNVELSGSFCCVVSSFLHALHAHNLEFVEDMSIYVDHVVGMSRTVFDNLKSLKRLKISAESLRPYMPNNTSSVIAALLDESGSTVLPSSLKSLELERCYLKPSSFSKLLNNLSSLDTLELRRCDTVERPCPPISLYHLRMLKRLHIQGCDCITSFVGSEALVSLEHMNIERCCDLKSVPDVNGMPSLKKLCLSSCPQVMALSCYGYQTALKELEIKYCDGLSSLGELRGLVSLSKMRVIKFSELVLLPNMDCFYSLELLIIEHCPRLRSLPRSGLPVSLKAFFLTGCHPALEEQFQRKAGPDWNKANALSGCMKCTDESSEHWGNLSFC